MNIPASLAVYFIMWWLTLFCVLPFGVRSHLEEGTVEKGSDGGAPVAPQLLKKALITTVISGAIFALFYWSLETGRLDFEQMPWFRDWTK
jgi:predicted secreted protein